MDTNKYLIIASTALGSVSSLAQSSNFEGSHLSLGLGSQNFQNSGDAALKARKSFGNIEYTHFKSLDDSWMLGFGIGLDAGTLASKDSGTQAGDIYYFDAFGNRVIGPSDYAYQSSSKKITDLKNNFSISFLPGYAFNKTTMLFGRFSFNRAQTVVRTSGAGGVWLNDPFIDCVRFPLTDSCQITSIDTGTSSRSTHLNGVGLGLGLRHKIDKQLFIQAEYKQVSYRQSEAFNLKPTTQSVLVSLGYDF